MKAPIYDATWPDDIKALYAHDMQEIWDRSIAPQVWLQYHNQLDLYQSLIPHNQSLRILDVGCAQATLALKLAEAGHEVVALDLRAGFLKYAESRYTHGNIRFVCGNVFADSMSLGAFDIVFANQIFEHVFDPVPKIEILARYLKPAGELIITTPNWEYFVNKLPSLLEFEQLDVTQFEEFTADGDGHVFAYTAEELEKVCLSAGLLPGKTIFFESPFVSGHFKIRYIQRILPESLARWIDRITLNLPWVGRKFAHQMLLICRQTS